MADSAISLQRFKPVLGCDELFAPLTAEARAENLRRTMRKRSGPVWVFAYGSLIWRPAFRVAESKRVRLQGYRRSFCLWSALARGTPTFPGLGLGVIRDAAAICDGIAQRVDETDRDRGLAALWEREVWTDAYVPVWQAVTADANVLDVLVFEANSRSRQFAGDIPDEEAARIIAGARGKYGTCRDYLEETYGALREVGIDCPNVCSVRAALPPESNHTAP